MKYYLTHKQTNNFWYVNDKNYTALWNHPDYKEHNIKCEYHRVLNLKKFYFTLHFKKLKYNQTLTKGTKAFYGSIEGDEKDITLFILQHL